MKFVLTGEKCTFFMGRYSQDEKRQQYLNHLASTCSLKLPAILMRNEQARVQELTRQGARSIWQQTLFCTWTADVVGERKTYPLSKVIDFTKLYVAALKENRGVGEWEKGGVGEEKLINVNNA
ncbi:hypothetical protein NIES4071_06570 [Calothrix sp. NIES-4071]|nr:hypothetical protein NIES4071_06570 [Calothrix sp. NIES-4071]BAZ54999.1 hypothetical protein NIES4105_06530 [Calothrix sp. NIES-4105]